MTNTRSPSLRTIILIRVVPAALALLILISIIVVRKVNMEISNQIQEQVNNRSEGIQLAVQTKLRQAIDACAAIANNHIVVNTFVNSENRSSDLLPFIRSLDFPGTPVHNIAVLDYKGEPIAQKLNHDPRLEALKSWLSESAEVDTFVKLDSEGLIVAQPVLYSSTVEGALVTVYDSSNFFDDLVVGSPELAIQLSYDDEVLAHSRFHSLSPAGKLQIPEGWFVSSFQIPELTGLVGHVWQSDRTAAEAASAVRIALAFAVVAISSILLLGLLLTVGFTTRQLNALLGAIKDVRGKADLTRRVSSERIAEFQQLQNQFNGMLSELEKTTVSRETYRIPALVANFTDNLVVVTDASGRIEWVNESFTRISGYTLAEVIGQKPGAILQGPETDPKTIAVMREAVSRKEGFDVDIVNYNKAGEDYWVSIESRPIRDESGEVINFIAIESDITAKRQAEEEKERMSQEMITLSRQAGMAEVATGVLHNIGNVLNSINVSTTLMSSTWRESKLTTIERIAQVLEQNEDNLVEFVSEGRGKHLPSLLRELSESLKEEQKLHQDELDCVAKSVDHIKEVVQGQQENARQVSTNEPVSLTELMDEAIRFNQEALTKNRVEIRREYYEIPNVCTDRHKVLQILVNLVGNAKNAVVECGVESPLIEIRIDEDDDSIYVVVKDNGMGIAKENLTRIFGHGFTTRKKGHGFGLHSSALAAEAVGGSLTVDSDGIGCGALFSLRLPIGTECHIGTLTPALASGHA